MTQLQGFGALLFGAVTLAFIGVLAVLFGGPLEITLAVAALTAGYASQYLSFMVALATEYGVTAPVHGKLALWLQWASIALAATSFILSVWF